MGKPSGQATLLLSVIFSLPSQLRSIEEFAPTGAVLFFNPTALRKAKIVYNLAYLSVKGL